jgi:sulfide dehydrogenase [flavocytochrome c] flavoprotein subunit
MKKTKHAQTSSSFSRRDTLKLLGLGTFSLFTATHSLNASEKSLSSAHIVIIGGGIGGASAAKYLRLLNPDVRISLIEPNAAYIFCPGSNEIFPGWKNIEDLTVTYRTLKERYHTNVIQDRALKIDYKHKSVSLVSGGSIFYDKLIVSPGPSYEYTAIEGYNLNLAKTRFPAAWHVSSQTLLLKQQILSLRKGGTMIISIPKPPYRCPPAPYERATYIAHMLQKTNPTAKVLILDSQDEFVFDNVYPYYWEKHFNFGHTGAILERITPQEGGHIVELNAKQNILIGDNGTRFKGDILNIIPPHKAGSFALDNSLAKGDWCPVEYKDFSSTKQNDVYVIGDSVDSDPMPKTGYIASNQARVVVQAINDELHGREIGTPFMINDCIAMVEQGFGMTLSEIFRYNGEGKRLKARHYIPGVDKNGFQQKMLSTQAEDWQENFRRSVFS